MDLVEFDRFADEYETMHAANIAVSGERPDYFADYKIRSLCEDISRLQVNVGRVLDFGSGTGNSIPFFRRYLPAAALTCADL